MPDVRKLLRGSENERETREVLKSLPRGVDRRAFFKGALAIVTGASLAGCTGGSGGGSGGGDGGGDGGDGGGDGSGGDGGGGDGDGGGDGGGGPDLLGYPGGRNELIYRNNWKDEPYEAHSWLAAGHASPDDPDLTFWEAAGIVPPTVQTGDGSGAASQAIGTGKNAFGHANLQPQIQGLAEGYDLKVLSGTKAQMGDLCLLYRMDKMSDSEPSTIEGKTLLVGSAFDKNSLQIYLNQQDLTEDDVSVTVAEHSSQFALMAQGDGDAMWGQVGNIATLRGALDDSGLEDVQIGTDPLFKYYEYYTYGLSTNSEVLEAENGVEYATRLIEGISTVGKWGLLNPTDAATYMVEINPNLQTRPDSQLTGNFTSTNAANLLDYITDPDKGMFWLEADIMQKTWDLTVDSYDLPDSTPAVDDFVRWDILEGADLAVLSEEEYEQAVENCQPYVEVFVNPDEAVF